MRTFRFIIAPLFLVFPLSVFSARTVTLTKSAGQTVTVTNPTSIQMSFSYNCFDTAGTSVINGSATLDSNKTWSVGAGTTTTCNNSMLPDNWSAGVTLTYLKCPGSVSFSDAETLCPVGFTLCSLNSSAPYLYEGTKKYWLTPGYTNWEYTTDYWSTSNSATGTGSYAPATSSVYANKCRYNDGTIHEKEYCQVVSSSTSADGALCCESSSLSSLAFCKVTINTTNAQGYLVSPLFKGGSPF